MPVQSLAGAGAASRETGNPARLQAPNPPSRSRTDGMAEVLEEPERARGAHARTARRRRRQATLFATPWIASTCSIIHMNALSGAGSVSDQAHTPQIEVERARDVTRRVGIGWPQVEDQQRLPAFDFARELRGRDQQPAVRIRLHAGPSVRRIRGALPPGPSTRPWRADAGSAITNAGAHHRRRNSTRSTAWVSPLSRIRCARSRVGRMFSRRFTRLIDAQMPRATSRASSGVSAA